MRHVPLLRPWPATAACRPVCCAHGPWQRYRQRQLQQWRRRRRLLHADDHRGARRASKQQRRRRAGGGAAHARCASGRSMAAGARPGWRRCRHAGDGGDGRAPSAHPALRIVSYIAMGAAPFAFEYTPIFKHPCSPCQAHGAGGAGQALSGGSGSDGGDGCSASGCSSSSSELSSAEVAAKLRQPTVGASPRGWLLQQSTGGMQRCVMVLVAGSMSALVHTRAWDAPALAADASLWAQVQVHTLLPPGCVRVGCELAAGVGAHGCGQVGKSARPSQPRYEGRGSERAH